MPDRAAIFNIEKYSPQLLPNNTSRNIDRSSDFDPMSMFEKKISRQDYRSPDLFDSAHGNLQPGHNANRFRRPLPGWLRPGRLPAGPEQCLDSSFVALSK
jgi:hypothetical protein